MRLAVVMPMDVPHPEPPSIHHPERLPVERSPKAGPEGRPFAFPLVWLLEGGC